MPKIDSAHIPVRSSPFFSLSIHCHCSLMHFFQIETGVAIPQIGAGHALIKKSFKITTELFPVYVYFVLR